MARTLKEICFVIMNEQPDNESWLQLETEVSEAMEHATEEEIDAFAESGAGEILDMSCSAIREINKTK